MFSKKSLLFAVIAALFATSIVLFSIRRDATPAITATAVVTPTTISTPTAAPAPTRVTHSDTEATFSAMGFGLHSWGIALSGDNKVCFADLRSDPRNCDGTTLKITAKTPLLVLKNGKILASLKIDDTVTLVFDQDTSYEFFGLAQRNYPFYGDWITEMFMWSDMSKTYPILLLPQTDGHDVFIDLAQGVTYEFTADATIFDYPVTTPTLGHLYCVMGETCVFDP